MRRKMRGCWSWCSGLLLNGLLSYLLACWLAAPVFLSLGVLVTLSAFYLSHSLCLPLSLPTRTHLPTYRWYSQAYITAAVELPQLRDQQQQQQLTSPPLRALHTTLRATLLPLVSLLSPLLASAGVDLSTTTTLTTATAAGSNTYSPQQQPTVSASQLLLDQLLATHLHKLQVMCQFMGRQAAGLPTGAHAAFKGLGVDAATLRVLMRNDAGAIVGPVGYTGGGNSADMVAMMMQRQQQPGLANITDSGGVSAAAFVSPISYYTQHQQFGGDPAAALGGGVQPQVLLGDASSAILVGFDSALHQLGNVMEAALRRWVAVVLVC